jgi:hypothetical protein
MTYAHPSSKSICELSITMRGKNHMRFALALAVFVLFSMVHISTVEAQVRGIQCGDITESEFTDTGQVHEYSITLEPGASFRVTVVPVGQTMKVDLAILDIAGNPLIDFSVSDISFGDVTSDQTPLLSSRGPYLILLSNNGMRANGSFTGSNNGVGLYTLRIGCTLADGTVIEPGDTIEPSPNPTQAPLPTTGSGFLFPELPQDGIELPLVSGQAQTIPVGNDIVLYTYDVANADQPATLSISRVSGDISLGITVMNRDTREIIFLGGMPSSNNLSVELTFPTSGTYAIGLFRLDTAERSGTSGAVQLVIE